MLIIREVVTVRVCAPDVWDCRCAACDTLRSQAFFAGTGRKPLISRVREMTGSPYNPWWSSQQTNRMDHYE